MQSFIFCFLFLFSFREIVSPRWLPYQANGALSPRRRGMGRRSGLIVERKDASGADGNTVGEFRQGDGWSLNPTSTICKGAKNFTPHHVE